MLIIPEPNVELDNTLVPLILYVCPEAIFKPVASVPNDVKLLAKNVLGSVVAVISNLFD